MEEMEKDNFIATVAMRYGYGEGRRRKRAELFRAQRKNGLDKIRQVNKRSKSLIDEVNSLSEFREKRNQIIEELQSLRQRMNNATVIERNNVKLFNMVVKYYDELIERWLMEHKMFKPQTEVPVELETELKEKEKKIVEEKKTPKKNQKK